MRSEYLVYDYWPKMCERVFSGLSMTGLPQTIETEVSESGFTGQGTNTYFTNGVEDPWQWATIRDVNNNSQFARTSDCDDCGHCVEMYTPTASDPEAVKETRDMIREWTVVLFGPELEPSSEQFLE